MHGHAAAKFPRNEASRVSEAADELVCLNCFREFCQEKRIKLGEQAAAYLSAKHGFEHRFCGIAPDGWCLFRALLKFMPKTVVLTPGVQTACGTETVEQ